MRPAVLYGAKSTRDPRGSIAGQLAGGRELALRDGWEPVAEYEDEAASAYHGDRGPGLAAARAHAERLAREHGECALVIQHSDRLARGDGVQAAHLVEYALWAIKAGVKLVSVQDPQTFGDLLYTVVTGQRNHEDSRRKALSVKAGMERRAAKGLSTGGPRPYGYRYPGYGRPLEVVPEEAVVVRRIFAEFIAGRTMSAIARGLHADGIAPDRSRYWRQSRVSNVLHNIVYTGRVRYDGEVVDGQHEPIVDEKTWKKASALLEGRPSGGRGRPSNGRHLFRGGMLVCSCGYAMFSRSQPDYETYHCGRRKDLGRGECDRRPIRRHVIDEAVFNYFAQVALDLDGTRRALAAGNERKLAEVAALRRSAELEAQRAAERIARVKRDYLAGDLTAAEWRELREELAADQAGAGAEVERLRCSEREMAATAATAAAESAVVDVLARLRASIAGDVRSAEGVDAVRAALMRLFDAFVIHDDVPERVHVELIAPEFWIEPIVRPDVIESVSDAGWPVLRPTTTDALTNTDSASRSGISLFAPIPVVIGNRGDR